MQISKWATLEEVSQDKFLVYTWTELGKEMFVLTKFAKQPGVSHFFIRITGILYLKVPKCEIFDRSDFPDFYTIKPLRVGDFGIKIKNIFKNIQGFIQGCKVPYAYAQQGTVIMMFFQKMMKVHKYMGVKNYSKTLL